MDDLFAAQKRNISELLLPSCPYVHLDGTHPKCNLPDGLRVKELLLRIGRDPNVMGIPDLLFGDDGFSATLSIGGFRVVVFVAWGAVWGLHIDKPFLGPQIVWPRKVEVETAAMDSPATKPGLRLVKNEG